MFPGLPSTSSCWQPAEISGKSSERRRDKPGAASSRLCLWSGSPEGRKLSRMGTVMCPCHGVTLALSVTWELPSSRDWKRFLRFYTRHSCVDLRHGGPISIPVPCACSPPPPCQRGAEARASSEVSLRGKGGMADAGTSFCRPQARGAGRAERREECRRYRDIQFTA